MPIVNGELIKLPEMPEYTTIRITLKAKGQLEVMLKEMRKDKANGKLRVGDMVDVLLGERGGRNMKEGDPCPECEEGKLESIYKIDECIDAKRKVLKCNWCGATTDDFTGRRRPNNYQVAPTQRKL